MAGFSSVELTRSRACHAPGISDAGFAGLIFKNQKTHKLLFVKYL
jgi:hypothetical protein